MGARDSCEDGKRYLGRVWERDFLASRLLFWSLCRVLPSMAERYCFTIWLSDTRKLPGGFSKEQLRSLLANVENLGESLGEVCLFKALVGCVKAGCRQQEQRRHFCSEPLSSA